MYLGSILPPLKSQVKLSKDIYASEPCVLQWESPLPPSLELSVTH